jgi:N-glycosylase/DNA lyase
MSLDGTALADSGTNVKLETVDDTLETAPPFHNNDDTEAFLQHYFNLTPNLTELYEQWSQADPNFKKRAPKFTGVRILKQDAWEALIGFICSSNNNIARISQMVGAQE